MQETASYRDILKIELAERIAANPSYSLRAFARQINSAPSLVSEVLSGKKNFSPMKANEIANFLKFDERLSERFVILVELEQTKSTGRKAQLLEKLDSLYPQRKVQDLSLDVFKVIHDWYHLALLELAMVPGFDLSSGSASARLGISSLEAENAIKRLLRLELLKKLPSGKLAKSDSHILATSQIPNDALRNYHQQMLQKASESLRNQTPQEKLVGSETFAFDEKHLPEASKIVEECFTKLVTLATSKRIKRDVYHVGIQFFKLTKKAVK